MRIALDRSIRMIPSVAARLLMVPLSLAILACGGGGGGGGGSKKSPDTTTAEQVYLSNTNFQGIAAQSTTSTSFAEKAGAFGGTLVRSKSQSSNFQLIGGVQIE